MVNITRTQQAGIIYDFPLLFLLTQIHCELQWHIIASP